MSIGSWEAEYQQNPIIVGGGQLPIEKLKTVQHFERSNIVSSVRYVDKAGTVSDDAAYSAFVLMHLMKDKTYIIEHVLRGRWSALEREEKLKALCMADQQVCPDYRVWIEQEPGSGGKESVEATIRNLAPIIAYADKVTGAKEVRAEPFCAAVQNGSVSLHGGTWVNAFRDEAEAWPNSRYKDQIDAAAGAFAKLAAATAYDTTYAAFDPYYVDR
jgi:predicted phage terminase large subunit-like protein